MGIKCDPETRKKLLALAGIEADDTPKERKYKNCPVEFDGLRFDSIAEANHWHKLKALEAGGVITNLRRQVPLVVEVCTVRVCKLVVDFAYTDEAGRERWVDVKGMASTPIFRLKKKLVRATLGIEVEEVR